MAATSRALPRSSSSSSIAAFAAYLLALYLLRRMPPGTRAVIVLAAAIQLVPLAAPLLLSTDAWTYWSYGWIGARSDGNPYSDPPQDFPDNPALDYMGSDWLGTTTVYGPAFTVASEPLAVVAGDSDDVAAWSYKALAAAAALAAALLAGRLARRRAFAIALVGWNPILAVHLAGGGHNDAWVGALIMAALALSASRRPRAGGALWVLAIAVKWVPVAVPRPPLARVARDRRGRKAPAGSSAPGPCRDRCDGALRRRLAAGDLPAGRQRGPRDELRDPAPAGAARPAGRSRSRVAVAALVVGLAVARTRCCAWAGAPRARRLPRARHDAVPRRLVPGLGGPARRRRGGRRRHGRTARAVRVSTTADDPDLRPIGLPDRRLVEDDDAILGPDDAPAGVLPEPRIRCGELRAGRVVEVARSLQVDRDPPRLTEHREAEDPPPLGEMGAEVVRGADGGITRHDADARAQPPDRASLTMWWRAASSEPKGTCRHDGKRPHHDARDDDENDEAAPHPPPQPGPQAA